MATGKQAYDKAISLMDAVGEDTQEYRNRALAIINALSGELYPYSDTFAVAESGKRPIVTLAKSLSDTLDLDDYCALSILPYGLAAQLSTTEDPRHASFLQQRYEEMRAMVARGFPQEFEAIEDAYSDSLTASGAWG